jgi:virginiamycin B lyase
MSALLLAGSELMSPTYRPAPASQDVLAEFDATASGSFVVNVPAVFRNDIDGRGRTLDLGPDGTIIAGNIIADLLEGAGLEVVRDEEGNVTVTNTDTGSAQEIFKTIRVGSQTITADSNDAELTFEAGEGLEFAVEGGKVVIKTKSGSGTGSSTVTNTTVIADDSGLEDQGETIVLETATDNLAIGTSVAEGTLTIVTEADTDGLVIQGSAGQTANLSEWRGADGNPLITFDKDGNATFSGTITQDGGNISGDTVAFTGSGNTLTLDIKTEEPFNMLQNGGLDVDANGWTSNTQTLTNMISNGAFSSNLNGWEGVYQNQPFQEEFSGSSLESSFAAWSITGGDLFGITEYTLGYQVTHHVSGPDGNIWAVRNSTREILQISPAGVVLNTYTLTSGNNPQLIVSGPDGAMWFGMNNTPMRLGRVTTNGIVTLMPTAANTAGIGSLVAASDGNFWYTTTVSGTPSIQRANTAGTVLDTYSHPCSNTRQMIEGGDGNFYLACLSPGATIYKITPTGTVTTLVSGMISNVQGLAWGPDGNLWGAGENTGIRRITPGGTLTNFTGGESFMRGETQFGSDGAFYYVSQEGRRIWRSTTSGVITSYTLPAMTNPYHPIPGPDGNIWVNTGSGLARMTITGPEIVTTPTFSFSAGALRIPSSSNPTLITQTLTLESKPYTLQTYAYISSTTPVSASHVQMMFNGSAVDSTYTAVGGGWYRVSATVNAANTPLAYGVRVLPGVTVVLDDISVKKSTTGEFAAGTFYGGVGSAMVTAPSGSPATFVQSVAAIPQGYSLTAYAYTNGSAVTTGDVELIVNGATIPTSVSPTASAGWYRLAGAFSLNSEQQISVGVLVKQNRTAYVDDVSLMIGSASSSVAHRTTGAYAGSAGAVEMNAIGRSAVTFTQPVTITTADTYSFFVRAYNSTPGLTGSSVSTSALQLTINGTAQTGVSVTPVDDDFYEFSVSAFLTPGTYPIGLQVATGNRLIVDNLSFQQGSGNDKTVLIANTGSGLAKLNVESTAILNAGIGENEALVVVGSANQVANLTEWRDSLSNVLAVVDKDGRFGIGTTTPGSGLSVAANDDDGYVSSFRNASSSDSPLNGLLRLSTAVSASGTDARFIQFYAGATSETNGTGIGRIRLNNGGVSYESGGADFAEYFSTDDASRYEAGDVVALDGQGRVVKTTLGSDRNLLGVVSDTAAFIGNAKETYATDSGKLVVGLLGQLDVKVSTIGGEIRKGDLLTSSPVEGYAMKASGAGMILGTALEDFDGTEGTDCPVDTGPETSCGRVRAYVSRTWNSPYADVLGATAPYEATDSASAVELLATASGSATFDDGIAVLGDSNLSDVFVTGDLSVGLLRIAGLDDDGNASIDTMTGALLLQSQAQGSIELMGGRVTIDRIGNVTLKDGVIRGNDRFIGEATVPAGRTSVRVEKDWAEVPSNVILTPLFDGRVWVDNTGTDGFTINLGEARAEESNVAWIVFFKDGE